MRRRILVPMLLAVGLLSGKSLAGFDLSRFEQGFQFAENAPVKSGQSADGKISVKPVLVGKPGSGNYFELSIKPGGGGYPGIDLAFKKPLDFSKYDVLAVWFKADAPLNYFQLVFNGADGVIQDTGLAGAAAGFDAMVKPGMWYRAYVHYKAGGWVRYGKKMNWSMIKSLRFYTWDELLNKQQPVHNYEIGGLVLLTVDEAKELIKAEPRTKPAGAAVEKIKHIAQKPYRHNLQNNEDYQLWTDSGSAIISPDKIFQGGPASNLVEIDVAANEYEIVQLAIRPKKKNIKSITVQVSDFKDSKSGAVLPAKAFNWYRADKIKQQRGALYETRYYFDPLIEKAALNAQAGQNSVFVIEVKPDYMQLEGIYHGRIELLSKDEVFRPINVRIRLRPFMIPFARNLDTQFCIWNRQRPGYDETWQWKVLADYRVSPGFMRLSPFAGSQVIEILDAKGTAIPGRGLIYGQGAKQRMVMALHELNQNKLCTDFQVEIGFEDTWQWKQSRLRNARSFAGWLDKNGFLSHCYQYLIDEPHGDKLKILREIVNVYRLANPEYTTLCTTSPKPELYGYVDLWVVPWGSLDAEIAKKRQQLGEQIWVYNSSLMSIGQMPRLIGWVCFKYNLDGYLHYAIDYTDSETKANPWNSTGAHLATLFYPRQKTWDDKLDYFANSRKWDWKIPSIRMMQVRDGFEDFEYMVLLKKWVQLMKRRSPHERDERLLTEAEKMLRIGDDFIYDFVTLTDRPEDMLVGRKKVADMIEKIRTVLTGTQQ